MNKLQQLFKRYPLFWFFLLAYLLSWWSVPFANGQIIPHGPALAAVIVLAITSGKQGLRELWRRVTHWRVAWYWYVIGPGLIAAYLGGGYVLALLSGVTPTNPPRLPVAGLLIELLLLGGMWEEPGWSGFALPRLQERYAGRKNGVLLATLILGAFRAIWHLPLFFYGHIPWFDLLIFSFAFQIMITWLFNRSGGSALIVMIFHFASNVLAGGIMLPAFEGTSRLSFSALFIALAGLIALIILFGSRLRLGYRPAVGEATA